MAECLISCVNLSHRFGAKPIFNGLSFHVHSGDKIGLIGANGCGKSTLLRMMAGELEADAGHISLQQNSRVIHVAQDPDFDLSQTVKDLMLKVQQKRGWSREYLEPQTQRQLGLAGFVDFDQTIGSLSGGWQKRLSLVVGLVQEPDLLLLDEPTNHLDLESRLWLEDLLRQANFSLVLISHDRAFLDAVPNKIAEISPLYKQGLMLANGSYEQFLDIKKDYIIAQQNELRSLSSHMEREQEWLSRQPKARSTKQQARIQQAEQDQQTLNQLKEKLKDKSLDFDWTASGRQTKKLLELKEITKTFNGRTVIKGLNFVFTAGMKLGLAGRNASGKSTLLKLLAEQLQADQGELIRAPQLKVVYFDQERASLDLNQSLSRSLAPESDSVIYQGRSLHVAAWAKKFLFRPEQMDIPVANLSGGERARLLIARLLLEPADILLLDEPTNDLDIDTLEILEQSLIDFPGALVLVTHDRYMLKQVCQRFLALDGNGHYQIIADLDQWVKVNLRTQAKKPAKSEQDIDAPKNKSDATRKRLSYKEQREFDGMETAIQEAEARVESCRHAVQDPNIASQAMVLAEKAEALRQAEEAVEVLYLRWAELEAKIS